MQEWNTYLERVFGSNITTKRMSKQYEIGKIFGFSPFLERINEPCLSFCKINNNI